MPRRSRIDALGVLQHIIVRGIERKNIFKDDADIVKTLKNISAYSKPIRNPQRKNCKGKQTINI